VRRAPGRVEVWRDLPLWFLWVAPFALLDLDLNHLGGPLWPALVAFALPFGLVTWVFARAPHRRRWWLAYGLGSGALLAMAIGGWTGPRLDTVIMLRIFEVAALVEFAVLAVHAWWVAGRRTFWLIFGVGLVYGLILENAGVALGFFAEEGYLLYFPGLPAPVATSLGWCVVFYPLWWAAPRLVGEGAGHARKAMAATGGNGTRRSRRRSVAFRWSTSAPGSPRSCHSPGRSSGRRRCRVHRRGGWGGACRGSWRWRSAWYSCSSR